MTTITYNILKVTETEIFDPESENFEVVDTTVVAAELEIVFKGDITEYSYERDDFGEVILFDPDGELLDAYEFRVDGQAAAFSDSFSEFIRVEWGDAKETELFVIALDTFAFEDIEPGDEVDYSFYIARLDGDSIAAAAIADYDGWLDTFPTDEDDDPESFDIETGPFRAGQQIAFSEADAFVSISEDDYVDAAFSAYTTFDLGKGDDTFIGSGEDERVTAGKGNDVIDLGDGDDYVRVGGGVEEFYGGAGTDYISYYSSSNGITVNLATNEVSGSWASNDIVEDFEGLSGSKTGDDSIIGTSGANIIRTYGGDDRVAAGSGSDKVELGSGDDYVRAGGGKESFYGGDGKDWISYYDSSYGVTLNLADNEASGSWASNDIVEDFESVSGSRTGDDSITGTSGSNTIKTYGGDDRVAAGSGTDRIELGSGDDYVRVGGGKETFDGGSGKDYISYYSSSNGIRIDLRDDEVSGSWASNDTIKDFESASGSRTGDDTMLGTNGSNTLKSYGGDDKLYGRGGGDKLYGGSGEDFLDGGGGSGTDLLYGGSGADIFEFDRGEGVDIIKDFENNVDTINLDNFDFGTGDAYDFADEIGDDVVFDFGDDGMLTVENATIAQLQNDLEIV